MLDSTIRRPSSCFDGGAVRACPVISAQQVKPLSATAHLSGCAASSAAAASVFVHGVLGFKAAGAGSGAGGLPHTVCAVAAFVFSAAALAGAAAVEWAAGRGLPVLTLLRAGLCAAAVALMCASAGLQPGCPQSFIVGVFPLPAFLRALGTWTACCLFI